ncbi:hypothetical protein Catovirus_1_145 [Catovirus CTV1]|uniref:Uncharacterized protein n=1 Tax=Catovirus CTV1 TaxID=1977631 RepID=A0A1V0S8R2_9VIRU|nr:hypothetical protein Catovirus_1_145 [Catovirus CTV1]
MYKAHGNNVRKLGYSIDTKKRIFQYTTAYIDPVVVDHKSKPMRYYREGETILFTLLKDYRVAYRREFFDCELSIIKEAIDKVCDLMNDKNAFKTIIEYGAIQSKIKKRILKFIKLNNLLFDRKNVVRNPTFSFFEKKKVGKSYHRVIKGNIPKITKEMCDNIDNKISKKGILNIEQYNAHNLKVLLDKFNYSIERYNGLSSDDQKNLINFISKKKNYHIYHNCCEMNDKNIKIVEDILKKVGFNSIRQGEKQTVDIMKENIIANKKFITEKIALLEDKEFINQNISIKTIGNILRYYCNLTFGGTSVNIDNIKYNAYKLEKAIDWGNGFYLQIFNNKIEKLENKICE